MTPEDLLRSIAQMRQPADSISMAKKAIFEKSKKHVCCLPQAMYAIRLSDEMRTFWPCKMLCHGLTLQVTMNILFP